MNSDSRFSRSEMLLGEAALEVLRNSSVAVFGLGGVGGAAVEALVRSGVGTLHLVDDDVVSESNINRQLIATVGTIGLPKTEVMKARILEINPDAVVYTYQKYFSEDNTAEFDFSRFDYIIDAIDSIQSKVCLVESAKSHGIPIICSMGTGNKLDPTRFKVADIAGTSVCPLARAMRRELKKKGIASLKVVYSTEEPGGASILTQTAGGQKRAPGSVSFVPPVAGFILAGEAIKDLTASSRL
ncbi:MAG: tRNA threonylcarbamoyladenosine dehydratase [Saccharofermentanales bacterium]